MGDTTLRQLTLLQLLPRRQPGLTTTALRSRLRDRGFVVHLRTVQRDLDRLSSRFGFTCDEGSPPRWYWSPGAADLSLPSQDPFSALTWSLVAQHLEPLLPRSLLAELDGQFAAARAVLQNDGATLLRRWQARVRTIARGMPQQPPDVDAAVLDAVYAALLHGQQLSVRYQSRHRDEPKTLNLQPLGLVFRDHCAYLVATANDYSDVLQFALHRISEAEVLKQSVLEPDGFNLDAYISAGGFLYPQGGRISLVLHMDAYTAQHLLESPLSSDQRSQALDNGHIEISATVTDSQQLLWWLLGFGAKVEVKAPQALRERVAEQAQAVLEHYQDPSD